jgi:hypothetical protein
MKNIILATSKDHILKYDDNVLSDRIELNPDFDNNEYNIEYKIYEPHLSSILDIHITQQYEECFKVEEIKPYIFQLELIDKDKLYSNIINDVTYTIKDFTDSKKPFYNRLKSLLYEYMCPLIYDDDTDELCSLMSFFDCKENGEKVIISAVFLYNNFK